jgi:hypothetical protein
MQLTIEQLDRIKNKEISEAILTDGSKARIFFATNGYLCQFRKGSRKYGYYLDQSNIQSLVEPKPKKEKSIDEKTFKVISKFRKEALKATFTNDFIRDCIALPDTFEKWVADGKKSPYKYGVTTGCKITGDLVSVETIAKKMYNGNALKQAIAEKKEFRSGTFPFQGYDGSVSIEKNINGEIRGFLNKEYKNCGNGYYYLLINDNYFIGYCVD